MSRQRVPYSQLSTKQKEVILLMKDGWELGMSRDFRSDKERWRLQEGGLGKSGAVKQVHALTGRWLVDNDYVERVESWNTLGSRYRLTGKDL